jgi:hypothetical protein
MKRTLILLSIFLCLSITSHAQEAFEISRSGNFLTVKALIESDANIAEFGKNDSLYFEKPQQISVNVSFITNIEFQTSRKERGSSVSNNVIKIYLSRSTGVQCYALLMKSEKFDLSDASKEYNKLLSVISKAQ